MEIYIGGKKMNKGSSSALAHIASIVAKGDSPSQPEEPFIYNTTAEINYQRLNDQSERLANLAARARKAEEEIKSARSSNDNVTVKASRNNSKAAVQKQAVTTEEDDLSSLGILFGFLTVFLVFVIAGGMALSYLSYSFQAKVDYDDVIARSYKANEAIRERDNQLDLLLNSLKNQERKDAGVISTEKFVPSTDLQKVLTARDEYQKVKVTDFAAFNAANKVYLTELSNYLATHKQDSSVYYYAKSSNLKALIELDNYNHFIIAYRNRFNSKVYTWIANNNKGHEDYCKVVPLDTTDYLSD